jgi:hypothetical protein
VCSHHDLGAAGGGHHDICEVGDATWMRFMGFVKEAYDDLGNGAIPAFALTGAPDAHNVELPNAAPEASHGGASRRDSSDVVDWHSTLTGFSVRSGADLQVKLNRAGTKPPLIVDGYLGHATRGAIIDFQRAHGLTADGQVGPATWAALEKVTSK